MVVLMQHRAAPGNMLAFCAILTALLWQPFSCWMTFNFLDLSRLNWEIWAASHVSEWRALVRTGGITTGHVTHTVNVVIPTELQFTANLITGTIPSELASLTTLTCKYDDGVPHMWRWSNALSNVFESTFHIHWPASMPTNHHISVLSFFRTDITGTIPTFIGTFTDLGMFLVRMDLVCEADGLISHLHLHSSSFSLPVYHPSKGFLDIMSTPLEGTIPTELFQLTKLTREWESRCLWCCFFRSWMPTPCVLSLTHYKTVQAFKLVPHLFLVDCRPTSVSWRVWVSIAATAWLTNFTSKQYVFHELTSHSSLPHFSLQFLSLLTANLGVAISLLTLPTEVGLLTNLGTSEPRHLSRWIRTEHTVCLTKLFFLFVRTR